MWEIMWARMWVCYMLVKMWVTMRTNMWVKCESVPMPHPLLKSSLSFVDWSYRYIRRPFFEKGSRRVGKYPPGRESSQIPSFPGPISLPGYPGKPGNKVRDPLQNWSLFSLTFLVISKVFFIDFGAHFGLILGDFWALKSCFLGKL